MEGARRGRKGGKRKVSSSCVRYKDCHSQFFLITLLHFEYGVTNVYKEKRNICIRK